MSTKKPSPRSHVRTALQLESARAQNEKLRDALTTALAALERVQPQIKGALSVQDVAKAIGLAKSALSA